MQFVEPLEAKAAVDGRGGAHAHFALLEEPEVVQAALAAPDAQNQPCEQADDDQGLDRMPFFLPE